jgi:RNA polymerase sigma-70 factor (ECF subfamily)
MSLKEKAIERGFSGEDLSDVVMIENISKGDMKAFGELYSKYYKVVFKKLLMLFGDTEKAKDLASEVMIKAKENIDKFNVEIGSGKVDGWIKTIAHNAFLDIKRKEKNGANFLFLDNDEVKFEVSENKPNSEEKMIIHESLMLKNKKLQNVISKLKEIERKIIFLKFYKELSYDEISEILNIDSSDLRVAWHRLKAKLEKRMK